MPVKDLLCVMTGKEASTDAFGTAAVATNKHVGISDCSIKPIVESEILPELKGTLVPGYNSVIKATGGEASITGAASYEDIVFWLDGLFGPATPGAVDTDGNYLRSYAAPTDAACSPQRYTLIYGDCDDDYKLSGATISKFSMKGESGGTVEFTADFVGKTMASDGWNSDVADSDRTVSIIMGGHCALYVDVSSDAAGTTAVTTTAFSYEMAIDPKRALKYHLGSLAPDATYDQKWDGELKLTVEVTSTTLAWLDSMIAPTSNWKRIVRLDHTSGTQYLKIDFGGVLLEPPQLFTDKDGVVTAELTLKGFYMGSLANWLKVASNSTRATVT